MNHPLIAFIDSKISFMNEKALQEEIEGRKDTLFHKYLQIFKRAKLYVGCVKAEKQLKYELEAEVKTMQLYNLATITPINELTTKYIMNNGV
jgi:hypothetical protein